MTMEIAILNWIQNLHTPLCDNIMVFITHLGDKSIFWLIMTFGLILYPKYRKLGITVAIAIMIETICCNLILKPLVARIRPFDINTSVQLLIAKPLDFSFPSGHTGVAFAVVSVLFFRQNKMWIVAGILAVLIGFSRLYLYVHFPTDVISGAVLGILCGLIASYSLDMHMI